MDSIGLVVSTAKTAAPPEALGGFTISNQLIIRSVAPTDFAQWQPLWEGYNLFYGRAALPTEITQRTWSRFFDAYEPVHAMVAEKGGQLLGLVHYLFHRSTLQIAPTCYLQDLFTNEAQARLRLRLFGEKTIVSRERSTGESIYPEGNVLEGGRVSKGHAPNVTVHQSKAST
jgi:hypothetical protein